MKNLITHSFLSLGIICIFSCVFTSCKFSKETKNSDAISKEITALEVVENAINAAGTNRNWKKMASLTYTKKSRLLLENGEIESEVTQRHHYELRPQKSIKITWIVQKDSFLIVHNDSVSQKFKNGSIIDEGGKVKASVNSAMYVIGMPFKLLDKGTVLSYEGLKSLNTIDTVHTINATYAPKKHQNHSTQDEWWYHFDKNTGAFLSSMVYHEPTYALIENIATTKQDGLTFPERRKSYRCDASGKKLFLRAEFWYEDYAIIFLDD
ncbi:DUF6503 family protein [Maribacter sp. 2308TA10-17]|uniref:DUF6503 family protein n=1 Tax=Maribacter sp. 2308TA10-17 TaxID=3386276 RepID=UPI0039BD4D32